MPKTPAEPAPVDALAAQEIANFERAHKPAPKPAKPAEEA